MNKKKLNEYLGESLDDIQKNEQLKQYSFEAEFVQIGTDYYLTNRQKGIGFVFNSDKKLIAIHLHDGLENNYNLFPQELPKGLHFSDDMENAHKKIGISKYESGGGEILPILGLSKFWRKYQFGNYYLHLSFHDKGKSISLVTLGIEG